MKTLVVLVLAALAIVSAQPPTVSNSTVSTLTLGQIFTYAMTPLPASTDCGVTPCYDNEIWYRVMIPMNAASITLQVNQTNSNCNGLYYFYRSKGLTAPYSFEGLPSEYFAFPATYYDYFYTGSTLSTTIQPDWNPSSAQARFTPGDYFYFALSRETSSDAQTACSWSGLVTATYCPNNTAPVQYPSYAAGSCVPAWTVSATNGTTWSKNFTNTTGPLAFRVTLPYHVGDVHITVNSTDNNLEVWTNSYTTAGSSLYHNYASSYSDSDSVSGTYLYVLDSPTPRAGDFWITVFDYSDGAVLFNADITVSYTVCQPGLGGPGCAFQTAAFNPAAPGAIGSFVLPYTSGSQNNYFYWYVDVPTYSTQSINTTLSTSGSSAYIYWRYGGFPYDASNTGYDSSYNYQSMSSSGATASWILTPEDTWVGGRYYFALENYGSSNLSVVFNGNAVPPSTSTGSVTGVSSSGNSTTAHASTSGSVSGVSSSGNSTTTGKSSTSTAGSTGATGSNSGSSAGTTGTTGSASSMVPSLLLILFFAVLLM